jgi:hypothetical protein
MPGRERVIFRCTNAGLNFYFHRKIRRQNSLTLRPSLKQPLIHSDVTKRDLLGPFNDETDLSRSAVPGPVYVRSVEQIPLQSIGSVKGRTYQTQVLITKRSFAHTSTTELSTMMVRSRVSILASPEEGWRMSNRRSLPASPRFVMPGVRRSAALELERSMMRDSLENSVKEALSVVWLELSEDCEVLTIVDACGLVFGGKDLEPGLDTAVIASGSREIDACLKDKELRVRRDFEVLARLELACWLVEDVGGVSSESAVNLTNDLLLESGELDGACAIVASSDLPRGLLVNKAVVDDILNGTLAKLAGSEERTVPTLLLLGEVGLTVVVVCQPKVRQETVDGRAAVLGSS